MSDKKKKYSISTELSVWALLARSCFYKISAVMALMAMAECALFSKVLYSGERAGGFEGMIAGSRIQIIFLAALGLVYLVLVRMERMLGERSRYTLMRLRIGELHFFLIKVAGNLLFLILLFAVQIGLVFGMGLLYRREAGAEAVTPQFLFLAFYRNDFLHCLLPMADAGKWIRNILMLLAFSMESAGSVVSAIRGRGVFSLKTGSDGGRRNYVTPILLFSVAAQWFVSPIGSSLDLIGGILYAILIMVDVTSALEAVSRKGEEA